MLPIIIGAVSLIAYGLFEENNKPKAVKKMAKGGNVKIVDNFTNKEGIEISMDKSEDGEIHYSALINMSPLQRIVPMNKDKDYVIKRAKKIQSEMAEYLSKNKDRSDELNKKFFMAKGGAVDMYSKFDLNKSGNYFATINNKNYEIIYRDDKSQMYDLFENNKKIKSDRSIRNLMKFPKMANGGGVKQKFYNEQFGIGKSKYVVNFYDGVKTNKDGSAFLDIKIFKNIPDKNKFINELKSKGYTNKQFAKGGAIDSQIDALYEKSGFINDDFNWKLKLIEMLQDYSVEAYQIYQKLTAKEKEAVLQELFEMDNDMGSEGDGEIETSRENLEILLEDAKNGKKYAKGGNVNNFDKIFAEYEDNEDNNYHSENVVLLAENFGSAEDLKLAKSILKKHQSEGSLSGELGKKRYALHQKLYPKLMASKPKTTKNISVNNQMPKKGKVNLKNDVTYIPKRDIQTVELKNFRSIPSSEIIDGVYRKKLENGGKTDTWENILVDFGFKKSRTKLGVKYYKKGKYFASVDNRKRMVELYFEDIELYSGYSIQGLIDELDKEFKH
jgi:hypothetical protein